MLHIFSLTVLGFSVYLSSNDTDSNFDYSSLTKVGWTLKNVNLKEGFSLEYFISPKK